MTTIHHSFYGHTTALRGAHNLAVQQRTISVSALQKMYSKR